MKPASTSIRRRYTNIEMAGVAGLEPVTSAVTGQRSNQLSYTPAKGDVTIKNLLRSVKFWFELLRVNGWKTYD